MTYEEFITDITDDNDLNLLKAIVFNRLKERQYDSNSKNGSIIGKLFYNANLSNIEYYSKDKKHTCVDVNYIYKHSTSNSIVFGIEFSKYYGFLVYVNDNNKILGYDVIYDADNITYAKLFGLLREEKLKYISAI